MSENRTLYYMLELSLNCVDDLISLHDKEYRIIWANESFCRFTGKALEEIKGMYCYDILLCGRGGKDSCPHYNILRDGRSKSFESNFLQKKNCFLVSASPVYDKNEKLLTTIHIAKDITLIKEMERTVRDLKDFSQEILENLPFGVLQYDDNYRLIYENAGAREILGVPEGKISIMLNCDIRELPEKQRNIVVSVYEKTLKGERISAEIEYTSLYNRHLFLQVNTIPVYEKERISGVLMILHDVTKQKKIEEEKKRIQDELFQLAKIESIGKLTGGIAHDFNNILTVINGNLDFLREHLKDAGEDIKDSLYEVRRAAERATSLTSQLLAFSRRQIYRPRVLDLNNVIRNLERMLVRLIGENINLKTELNPALKKIKADHMQLEQIIINLVTNSRDAMPDGGTLIIKTDNEKLEDNFKKEYPFVVPGEYVLLSVQDNGCGMAEEIKTHIFEPFFTTKEIGRGTGLGLAVVYGIVKQNRGFIFIDSEINKGTVVRIYLPVTSESEEVDEDTDVIAPENFYGDETILVVEDEESVRKFIVRTLKSAGYRVFEAHNAGSAIEMVQGISRPVDLLLSDVVLPDSNGRVLAEGLKKAGRIRNVLYMSGYTQNIIAKQGVVDEGIELINKPFTTIELLTKVRNTIKG